MARRMRPKLPEADPRPLPEIWAELEKLDAESREAMEKLRKELGPLIYSEVGLIPASMPLVETELEEMGLSFEG